MTLQRWNEKRREKRREYLGEIQWLLRYFQKRVKRTRGFEGDEDDTLNNGASQLARSRCFSFFFFFLHATEFQPLGDVFFRSLPSEEREMQAKFKFTPGPGCFLSDPRKNEIDAS